MGLLKSLAQLLLGILKRLYWLIPSLFTAPFDFIERWFNVIYEPPQVLFWLLLFLGLAIATMLTYHELRVQCKGIIEELIEHPFTGDGLTSQGIQWSGGTNFTRANELVEVEKTTIGEGVKGELRSATFALTAAFRSASSQTANIAYKWQVRNKGKKAEWINLHDIVVKNGVGTEYQEETQSGYFKPKPGFTSIPFELRLVIQCNELKQGQAKAKNSSYVKVEYFRN